MYPLMVFMMTSLRDYFLDTHWDIIMAKCLELMMASNCAYLMVKCLELYLDI